MEFNVGDLVRILNPNFVGRRALERVEDVGFNDEMEELIDEEHYIESEEFVGENKVYRLVGCNWVWAPEWLELVVSEQSSITDEDFDTVFN